MNSIPTLDEISREPERLQGLDSTTLFALALRANSVAGMIAAHLAIASNGHHHPAPAQAEEWVTVEDAAELAHKSRRWFFRNSSRLPFIKRVSARSVVVSRQGLERWISRRKA